MKLQKPAVYFNAQRNKWVVDLRTHGGKRECKYKTKALAESRANVFLDSLIKHGKGNADLPLEVIVEVKRCQSLLEPLGGSLWKACEHYAEYLTNKRKPSAKVEAACIEWLEVKKLEGLLKSSIVNHRSRLKQFFLKFGKYDVQEIDHETMHAWLHGLKLAEETKADYRKTINELFEWCIWPKKWCSANPCRGIEFDPGEKEVRVFSIEEARKLFEAAKMADPDIYRYVVLCMFCGLRPMSDTKNIIRESITPEYVKVETTKRKKNSFKKPRFVPLEVGVYEKLVNPEWEGRLFKINFAKRWDKFRYDLGYKVWYDPTSKRVQDDKEYNKRPVWPKDVLRHTYCTYHLACFEDEAKTALYAGHKVQVLRKHYNQPIPKSEALKFWELIKG